MGSFLARAFARQGRLVPSRTVAALMAALIALCLALAPSARAQALRDLVPGGAAATAGSSQPPKAGAVRVDAVEAELVAAQASATPGQPLRLGLRLAHDPHWHTYWRNPGDSGLATQLSWSLPAGWAAGEIEWPAPRRIAIGPLANYGYEDEIVLPVTVRVPADAPEGRPVTLSVNAQWLVCKDVCIPGEASLALTLPVTVGPAAPSRHAALFEAAARAAPHGSARRAALHVDEAARRASLVFDSDARSAEFFPFEAGVVRPVAPQALLSAGDGKRRIDLELAEEADPAALRGLDGLVLVDGTPVELRAERVQEPPPDGARLGVALAQAAAGNAASSRAGSGATAGGWTDTGPGIDAAALAIALVSGLVGGLLLNLMPCVFPVIGLKLLGFARDAEGDPRAMRRHATAFAVGVVFAFLVLAAVLLGLRAAGEAIGWGFQLQSPGFVAACALLFVAIGLNFSGVFEVGTTLTRLGEAPVPAPAVGGATGGGTDGTAGGRAAAARRRARVMRAFGAGMLATLVATPCTAPFMGSAIGFTLGQPAIVLFAVLGAVGLGMAAPYLLLARFPALVRRLPRPGRWMESLRQGLAFPMYATAAWLAWVLGQQVGVDAVLRLSLAAVALAFALWLWGRFVQAGAGRRTAVPAAVVAAATLVVAAWTAWPGTPDPTATARASAGAVGAVATPAAATAVGTATARDWEPYSDERLAALQAAGRTVFVDFTAAWCISCQVNKKLVLDSADVRAGFERSDAVLLRADWTQRDERITRALARFGRNGVPLYLVWRAGRDKPDVLPELLTERLVLRALGVDA